MKTKQLALSLLTLVSLNTFATPVNIKQATTTDINNARKACIKDGASLFSITQDGLKGVLPITLSKVKTIRTPEKDSGNALAYDISPNFIFDKKSEVKNAGGTMTYTCNILIDNGKIDITSNSTYWVYKSIE